MTMSDAEMAAQKLFSQELTFALGSQFMAAIFDALFCGVIICQMTHWVTQASHDTTLVKCLVAFGVTAALGTTAFTWANYLQAFVYDFGKLERFASFSMLGWYAFLDVLTVIPVQMFFAERSVRINKNNKFVLFTDAFLILSTGAAALMVTVSTRGQTMVDPSYFSRVVMIVWPAVCTTTHVFLTSSILYGLSKTRTGVERANKLINRLMAVCLEAQIPGTLFALVAMITIAVNVKSPIIPFIIIVHPKVFMIGCLAMVNLRHAWRVKGEIPTTYVNQTNGSSHISIPGLSSQSSMGAESSGPTTPKFSMLKGFRRNSNPKSNGLELETGQIDDVELWERKA